MIKGTFKVIFLLMLVFMSSLAIVVNVKGTSNIDTPVSGNPSDITNVSVSSLKEDITHSALVGAIEKVSNAGNCLEADPKDRGLTNSVLSESSSNVFVYGRGKTAFNIDTTCLETKPLGTPSVDSSPEDAHWWLIHYWYSPTQMFGEFIAVDNTISGLSFGDAVLILPLNVAYGTGSSNFVWFQFDIRFRNLWPLSPVQVSIWYNIQSGTGPMQYNQVVIYDELHTSFLGTGLDYVAEHSYSFSLTTSGSNTATFVLIDRTVGRSWWRDFNVPSTNLLYNPTTAEGTAFSPASCVEGYTSQSALSNVPFFQFRVANGITSYIYSSSADPGPIPSGVGTDQNNINDDLWYWMMLTPGTSPIPSISSVDYPSSIGVGQSATIDATVINNGGTASWQTISISFPSDETISSVSIVQTDLSSSAIHGAGETVSAAYSTTTITLQNYLVEGSSSWPNGVSHHLKISVTPHGTGSFKFYVKSIAAVSNWACNWHPKTGDKDQQLEFVKTYTIAVGVNPSSISVNVNPDSIFLGGGTTISGSITSSTPGDKTGTVYLQYSTNNVNWNDIGSTTSGSSGAYSYWWEPSTTGTFYVRSYWNGNSQYGGAISGSFYPFKVKTTGGNLDDHCMCKGVQSEYPWDPIERTNVFYTDDPKAHSWLKFVDIYDGPHYVHWDWYDPDGVHWTWDSTIPAPPPGQYWVWYKKSSNLGPLHFAESKLGRPFTTKVYYDDNLVVTETWTVIKHDSSITVSLSSNSITYGQSVTIDSQLSPSFSDGTTTLQYSTDEVNWNNIATGIPSNGHYSRSWKPPAVGTYYVRAKWSGNLNYYGSTSSTKTLTVDKAATTLTTTLSSTTITYGASVTITASMSPQLQGKTVTIQYSLDNSNWYDLSSGTTNAAGQYAYSWIPAAASYYIRSAWGGDANYYGATSPTQQLTVNKASTSTSCFLSSNLINYGENVTVTGTVSVPVNDGTTTLEYSTNSVDWNFISSGTPSIGSYSYTWTPPSSGTFYVRAVWSGNYNYLGSTSSSQTLTVTRCQVTFYTDPAGSGFNITFQGQTYHNDTIDTFDYGTSGLATANAPDCWVFNHWETSGAVSVSNSSDNPTTVTVSGDGTLRAVYRMKNQPPSVVNICPDSEIVHQGDTIRIYCNSSDPETLESSLVCKIWIRPAGDLWVVSGETMNWDGSDHYYDWNISTSAKLGYYDVNCTVSDTELTDWRIDCNEFCVTTPCLEPIFSCDKDGMPKDEYCPDETIYVAIYSHCGCEWVTIYVVHDQTQWVPCMSPPDVTDDGPDFVHLEAGWNYIPLGTIPGGACEYYDIWVDVNNNEHYDECEPIDSIGVGTPGVHDVAITNVTPSKIVVGQSYCTIINVTIENQGSCPETFNVAAYANTTEIDKAEVTLTLGSSTTISFTWDTTGWTMSNYTISATADQVPGETDTADNTFIDGWVVVTIAGDIDGNYEVNHKDLLLLASAYGSKTGDTQYVPEADINCDCKIDHEDLLILAANYGKEA